MAIVPKVVLDPLIGSISILSKAGSDENDQAQAADKPNAMNIHKNILGRKFLLVIPPSR